MLRYSCLVLALLVALCNAQTPPPMIRFFLNTVSPDAICNDGTPAAYYFRAGYGSGADRWVIRLQGGGWCWDEESCKTREVKYTTSNVCPENLTDTETIGGSQHQGILSSNQTLNPYWYNANQVWLWYCTSDSHLGSKYANESLNGWSFLGKTVVRALIHHLLYVQQPSMQTATQVLLTGDSAGGVATLNNADFVGSLIAPVLPHVNYKAFVDAGWFLDIPAYGSSTFSFQMVAKNLFTYWGAIYDDSCVSHYGQGNEWMCFHSQYAWPFIETYMFYQEFQFDSANLGFDGIGYPFTSAESAYAYNFQQSMVMDISKTPYVFLPNCYIHETIDQAYFSNIQIRNVSISQAMWEWFSDTRVPPAPSHTVDSCLVTINCNPSCPPLPQ
jgi:hypothetical protein